MTSPVYTRYAIDGELVRKGRNIINPPDSPGTLTATAGDAQVSLSWIASPSLGVTYQIRRVNISTVVWEGSGTSTIITGLTNGVTYNFQVYAVDAEGRVSSPSNIATAQPVQPGETPSSTIYGFNWNSDTTNQTIAGRKTHFSNRVPCVRIYTSSLTSSFTVSSSTAQELRAAVSFKAGGGFTETQLANGSATSTMRTWLEDIPPNWTIYWTYHHEPNSSGGLEVGATNFVNTYHQMMLAKNSAVLQSGVKVYICVNFMAYQLTGSGWSDSWVPARADCDIFTWDIYGNPGVNTSSSGSNKYGGPATGIAYGTTYPLPSTRTSDMFAITERTGYADSWGILELNSPLRNWDTTESGRVLWLQDMLALFDNPPMAGAVPPKIVLMWEAPSGVNWNQGFGYNDARSINPDWSFGAIAYTSTKAANSPMWAVWSERITGTPVGG